MTREESSSFRAAYERELEHKVSEALSAHGKTLLLLNKAAFETIPNLEHKVKTLEAGLSERSQMLAEQFDAARKFAEALVKAISERDVLGASLAEARKQVERLSAALQSVIDERDTELDMMSCEFPNGSIEASAWLLGVKEVWRCLSVIQDRCKAALTPPSPAPAPSQCIAALTDEMDCGAPDCGCPHLRPAPAVEGELPALDNEDYARVEAMTDEEFDKWWNRSPVLIRSEYECRERQLREAHGKLKEEAMRHQETCAAVTRACAVETINRIMQDALAARIQRATRTPAHKESSNGTD